MNTYERIYSLITEGSSGERRNKRLAMARANRTKPAYKRPHSMEDEYPFEKEQMTKFRNRVKFRKRRGDFDKEKKGHGERMAQGVEAGEKTYKRAANRVVRAQGSDDLPKRRTLDALEKETKRSYSRNVGKPADILDTPEKVKIMGDIRKKPEAETLDKTITKNAATYRSRRSMRTKGVSKN
tara:strand:+ start:154 stop:699 length:546 start_codon:yes stop_codon:yes gene_type:complete